MEPARESNQRCRVAGKYDGVAHLVEQPYDTGFTAWFGAAAVDLDPGCWEELAWQDVVLDFEDGRSGEAYVPHTRGGQEPQGDGVGQFLVIYFVGVTTLMVPPHPAAPSPPATTKE
jgi:hypothetical protein